MFDTEVIDDFLSESEFSELTGYVFSKEFPWYLVSSTAPKTGDPNEVDGHFLSHMLFGEVDGTSRHVTCVSKVVPKILARYKHAMRVVRLRANLSMVDPACQKGKYRPRHTDQETAAGDGLTGILYLNDCDGDTLLFDEDVVVKRVAPKANRLVLFDSTVLHCGETPHEGSHRVLINFNFVRA